MAKPKSRPAAVNNCRPKDSPSIWKVCKEKISRYVELKRKSLALTEVSPSVSLVEAPPVIPMVKVPSSVPSAPIYTAAWYNGRRTGFAAYFGQQDSRNIDGHLPGNRMISGELIAIWVALRALDELPTAQLSGEYLILSQTRYVLNFIDPWADIWEHNSWRTEWGSAVIEAKMVQKIRHHLKSLVQRGVNVTFQRATNEPYGLELAERGSHGGGMLFEASELLELYCVDNAFEADLDADASDQSTPDTRYVYVNGTAVNTQHGLKCGYGVYFKDYRDTCGYYWVGGVIGAELEGIHDALRAIAKDNDYCSSYTLVCKHERSVACLKMRQPNLAADLAALRARDWKDHQAKLNAIALLIFQLSTKGTEIAIVVSDDTNGLIGNRIAEGFARAAAEGEDECMYYGNMFDALE